MLIHDNNLRIASLFILIVGLILIDILPLAGMLSDPSWLMFGFASDVHFGITPQNEAFFLGVPHHGMIPIQITNLLFRLPEYTIELQNWCVGFCEVKQ